MVLTHRTPAVQHGEKRLASKLTRLLRSAGKKVAAEITKRLSPKLGKAARPADEIGLGQRPAAFCLVFDVEGRILCVSRPEPPNEMAIPGGLVDPGELLGDAAARELAEECAVTVSGLRLVHTLTSPSDAREVHVFLATSWSGEPVAAEAGTRVAWLTPQELQAQASVFRASVDELLRLGLMSPDGLRKAAEEEEEDERIALDAFDWAPVVSVVQEELVAVARDGAARTLAILGVDDDESITEQTFDAAVEWAKSRAAELVGRSWDEDGNLVDNPDADMAITDTMRDEIREAVSSAIEAGDSAAELGDSIEGLASFSPERAGLIARSEIVNTHAKAQLQAMKSSGVVEKKAWSTAEDGDTCDDCTGNEDAGAIDIDDDFPSGDDAPIAHPACRCSVVAVIEDRSDSEDDSEDEDSEDDDSDE